MNKLTQEAFLEKEDNYRPSCGKLCDIKGELGLKKISLISQVDGYFGSLVQMGECIGDTTICKKKLEIFYT